MSNKKIVSKCFLNVFNHKDYLPRSNLVIEHSPDHNFVTMMTQHLQPKSFNRCIGYPNNGKYQTTFNDKIDLVERKIDGL